MLTISLTRHPHARKELLLDKTLRVVSRSGLNPTEITLINCLPALKTAQTPLSSPLFLGGRTGAVAMATWLTCGDALQGAITVHTFDAHTLKTLTRNLSENRAPESLLKAIARTDLSETAQNASIVFWQMTRGDGTAERDLETLEQLFTPSNVGPRQFLIAADDVNETFLKRFRKHCDHVTVQRQGTVTLIRGTLAKPITPEERATRMASFEVSLKGHDPITLVTLPGCFCHRRADMGGLALTEIVAEHVTFDKGDRIMDMGCGCGMDGILLATAFPEKQLHIDYQDSNRCACDSAAENLNRYPHASKLIFSADGEGRAASYDLFLANPPYFGDWRIAAFFIETAAKLLKRGGLLAFVSKREGKPLELMQQAGFEQLGTFSRRGYTVLLMTRR
jgi:16S rRNA (guanine1207-N2)-methyltransferase